MEQTPPPTTRTRYRLFLLSGLLPIVALLLGNLPDPLLLYSIFVLAYTQRERLRVAPGAKWLFLRFALSMFTATVLLESLAWLGSYLKRDDPPALFHPQLIPDILFAIGFYFGWTLVWYFLGRWLRFSVRDVFILTGLCGVVIEQEGLVFMAGLQTLPFGVWLWAYVFLVYGSAAALGYLPFRDAFTKARDAAWWKYLLPPPALGLASVITAFVWGIILLAFNLFPPPCYPIWEHPFWCLP